MSNLEKITAILTEDMEFFESLRPYAKDIDIPLFLRCHEHEFPVLNEYIKGKTQKQIAEETDLSQYKVHTKYHHEIWKFPLLMGRYVKLKKQDLMK